MEENIDVEVIESPFFYGAESTTPYILVAMRNAPTLKASVALVELSDNHMVVFLGPSAQKSSSLIAVNWKKEWGVIEQFRAYGGILECRDGDIILAEEIMRDFPPIGLLHWRVIGSTLKQYQAMIQQ